jgi:hypothetical protein
MCSIVLLTACQKDEVNPASSYEIPTSYTFDNVNYTGQSQRIKMLDELVLEIRKGNNDGVKVNATLLKEMFSNINNRFSDSTLNTSGKQIKDKTFLSERTLFEQYFDSLERVSASVTNGANGIAGRILSIDGTSKYLFNENGIEYKEVIEKGLYGAFLYYQITSVYLSTEKMNVDNQTVITGQGTAMQHHWDEAFGYLAVPTDFPTNLTGIKFLSRYINSRNAILDCNRTLMNAFIKGRAAINNKDYITRDAQIQIIITELERVMAATAINYLNQAKTNFADDAKRNHTLSECYGFIYALKFNTKKKITETEISELMNLLGTNYYEISLSNIETLKTRIAQIYSLESVKDIL